MLAGHGELPYICMGRRQACLLWMRQTQECRSHLDVSKLPLQHMPPVGLPLRV